MFTDALEKLEEEVFMKKWILEKINKVLKSDFSDKEKLMQISEYVREFI